MTQKTELPELLMPAGSIEKAYAAFKYGADAVYCGVPMFSLRTRENNVTDEGIQIIMGYAKKFEQEDGRKRKVYVTLNGFPHEFAIEQIKKHLAFLEEIKPDGIIFADLGVLSLANEFAPSVAKHLSVQTSTVNIPAMKMWMKMGVERVILAREMAIREVKKINEALPTLELEYFVHGAVCMAYSGRCLLSNFTGGRDANRGACNHTCRWNYKIYDEEGRVIDVSDHENTSAQKPEISEKAPKTQSCCETKSPETPCCGGKNKNSDSPGRCNSEKISADDLKNAMKITDFEELSFLEEEQRKDEIVPTEEDFHGTHIMSSRDMCMIDSMQKIWDAGVCSLKVEGRNKTGYYAATIARAYRKALDNMAAGEEMFDESLWEEIHATANRGFFPGFLNGKPRKGDIKYDANASKAKKEFCAEVVNWEAGVLEIMVKNKIDAGSELEIVMPRISDDFVITAEEMKFGGTEVEVLHGGNINKRAFIKCETELEKGTFIRQKAKNAGIKMTKIEEAVASYKA